MLKLARLSLAGNSHSQVDIEDISGGILKLHAGSYRLVLSVGSINFELRSEEEQDAIIDTYESILNSIGFSLQILIRTREINIDDYLKILSEKSANETDFIYKEQLISYAHFISKLVSANKILSRQFYIIIPFDSTDSLDIDLVRDQLNLRADIVTKNLSRLGIVTKQLTSIEIIDLFYSFYSPHLAKLQPISDQALSVINSEFVSKENIDDKH